jgi:hypothetical protein
MESYIHKPNKADVIMDEGLVKSDTGTSNYNQAYNHV